VMTPSLPTCPTISLYSMQMGQRTLVIVTNDELIHEAMVQRGPAFASRPEDSSIRLLFSIRKCAINSAKYEQSWVCNSYP
jgi:hypothetical protein